MESLILLLQQNPDFYLVNQRFEKESIISELKVDDLILMLKNEENKTLITNGMIWLSWESNGFQLKYDYIDSGRWICGLFLCDENLIVQELKNAIQKTSPHTHLQHQL